MLQLFSTFSVHNPSITEYTLVDPPPMRTIYMKHPLADQKRWLLVQNNKKNFKVDKLNELFPNPFPFPGTSYKIYKEIIIGVCKKNHVGIREDTHKKCIFLVVGPLRGGGEPPNH